VTQSRSKFSGIQKCLFFALLYAEDCRNSYYGRSEWIGNKSEPLSINVGIEINNKLEHGTKFMLIFIKKVSSLLPFPELSILLSVVWKLQSIMAL
jgi:hypothetical protein